MGSLTCRIMKLLHTVYTIFQKAVHVADRLQDLGCDGLKVTNISFARSASFHKPSLEPDGGQLGITAA